MTSAMQTPDTQHLSPTRSLKRSPSMLAKVFAKTEITQAEEALAKLTSFADENAKLAEELKQAKKETTELEKVCINFCLVRDMMRLGSVVADFCLQCI